MLDVEGFILVGGASSRMGADKSLLELGGRNFVERIHSALLSVAERVSLVGAGPAWEGPAGLPAIPDIHVKWGALGGLQTALSACEAPWAAVVACDLPFVSGELFVRLASLRGNFDAVVPVQQDGRQQPLCALYRSEACRVLADRLISSGERRPRALLSQVRTRFVPVEEWNDLPGADNFFLNVNTPHDYAAARNREGE